MSVRLRLRDLLRGGRTDDPQPREEGQLRRIVLIGQRVDYRLIRARRRTIGMQIGLSGLTVNFNDNSAGGTFSNPSPVTNASGQATTTYTTGGTTGTVTIDATYSTLPPAVFTETVD